MKVADIKELIYDKCGFEVSNFVFNKESQDYDACTFDVNDRKIIYRKAKITPTKTGQFVALWKRDENGSTQPYNFDDPVDIVIINTPQDDQLGQFVFPKSVLLDKGIFSSKQDGKRGFRVYPPWDIATSNQAQKTQSWQLKYFLSYSNDKPVDIDHAISLYLQE